MVVSVLVRPNPDNGFRATAPSHPEFSAEGPTEEVAISLLREQMSESLKLAKMVKVEIPIQSDKPWMAAAGVLEDVPDVDSYWESVLEYRRQVDADPNR